MTREEERRWHNRRSSVLSGQVVLNAYSPALPCTVENMSASGAQLTFATTFELPSEFVLEIPRPDLRVEARVVWSRAEQHGVSLVWPQRTPWA
jgi:hypothetical protein